MEEKNIRGEAVLVKLWGKAQPARHILKALSVAGPGANKDRLVRDSLACRHAHRGVDTCQSPRLQTLVSDVKESQGSGTRTSTHHPGAARHTF